jgi:hypothetical protein
MILEQIRNDYHQAICEQIIRVRNINNQEIPNFADKDSKTSVRISQGIVERLPFPKIMEKSDHEIKEQTAGGLFERITKEFLQKTFDYLSHVRPGPWKYDLNKAISEFEQYSHLKYVADAIKTDQVLSSILGGNYIITPDIVISRMPVSDALINQNEKLLEENSGIARYTPFRSKNYDSPKSILHASVSCKWTLRSDRSQNSRTEALNLIRNRKGNLPHVVAVTAEPYLNRLASLTLGTGDLDCVYHFALKELIETIESFNDADMKFMLNTMVEGKRLRDISDLPFDLSV